MQISIFKSIFHTLVAFSFDCCNRHFDWLIGQGTYWLRDAADAVSINQTRQTKCLGQRANSCAMLNDRYKGCARKTMPVFPVFLSFSLGRYSCLSFFSGPVFAVFLFSFLCSGFPGVPVFYFLWLGIPGILQISKASFDCCLQFFSSLIDLVVLPLIFLPTLPNSVFSCRYS